MVSSKTGDILDFVASNKGKVRFDSYMDEHLFNETLGFYENANIGQGGDFDTMAVHPMYAVLMHLYLKEKDLEGGDFLEIGGGNGHFKKNYLNPLDLGYIPPKTRYVSVDASRKLSGLQGQIADDTRQGSVTDIPVEDSSLEGMVFSNELLDALPCRVFKISNNDGKVKINEEVYIYADGERLQSGFMPAEQDHFLETYEAFLRETRPEIEDGTVISVSPYTEKALAEMDRVLRRGKIMIADYGYHDEAARAFSRRSEEMPFFSKDGRYHGLSEIIDNPYDVDITYKIDFDFVAWLARQRAFSSVHLECQHNWSGDIMIQNGLIKGGIPDTSRFPRDSSMFIAPRDFLILELDK
jgi:SAM-dependent MidA family methyltransferase